MRSTTHIFHKKGRPPDLLLSSIDTNRSTPSINPEKRKEKRHQPTNATTIPKIKTIKTHCSNYHSVHVIVFFVLGPRNGSLVFVFFFLGAAPRRFSAALARSRRICARSLSVRLWLTMGAGKLSSAFADAFW